MAKQKPKITKTLGPIHFEDLDPHRFEDLIRELIYDFRDWQSIEATGRSGNDAGFDIRAYERVDRVASRKSKFGYKCFKVQFLTRPPMYKEDWYPAILVWKQLDAGKLRKGILAKLSPGEIPVRVNSRALRQAMRQNVLELWEQVQKAVRTNGRA